MKAIFMLLFLLLPSFGEQYVKKSNADKMIMTAYMFGYKQGALNVLIHNHYDDKTFKFDSILFKCDLK